ncbi:MAG: hypothetical protein KDD47_00020, partial [Acidobacteria bacterium]|nr:hypothetical protein [Acidobacteriota bacterium]
FVADGARRTLGGLRVVEVGEPATPVRVGSTGDAFGLTAVEFDGPLALASDYFFVNAVPIFQAGDGDPVLRAALDFSGPPSFRGDNGADLALQDGVVYLAAGGLHIGRYRIPSDGEGVAPQVEVTAPEAGATVGGRTFLTLSATAEDDLSVREVEFLVDGVVVHRDPARPYTTTYLVPGGVASLSVAARATDYGGNSAVSDPVEVTVTPNTEPTIALLAPPNGSEATRLTTIPVIARATDDIAVERVEFFVDGTLRHAAFTRPYVFDWIQGSVGVRQVSATVYDDVGSASTPPVTVSWVEDQPPEVHLEAPGDGQEVVEGSVVRVTIAATDDAGLDRAMLYHNGALVRTLLGEPPYETAVSAPSVGGDLRLRAEVQDTLGHVVSTPEITLVVVPDPLTTADGRVVDEALQPVAGVEGEVATDFGSLFFSSSLPDGTFSVSDVPTNEGELQISATVLLDGELFRGGYLSGFETVPGGVTELGDMVLRFARPATRLVGLVTDDLGAPLAGATVRVHNTFDVLETTTDGAGAFAFPRIPVAMDEGSPLLDLFVSGMADVGGNLYRGRIPAPIVPEEGGETDAGTLALSPDPGLPDPLTTAVGFVQDSTGTPVEGAQVSVRTDFDLYQRVTLADGTFSIPGIPTVDGDLAAAVSALLDGRVETAEAFGPLAPVPGGVTDFETIQVGGCGDLCGLEGEE